MASIIKRKTKYSVVYTYTDSNGAKRQKWETCGSHAEAKKRKAEIEHQIDTGVFIPPSADTLSDFLDEYVSLQKEFYGGGSTTETTAAVEAPREQQAPASDPLQNLDAAAKQQLLLKLLTESSDMAALLTALAGRNA